jgi:hypothetical protein
LHWSSLIEVKNLSVIGVGIIVLASGARYLTEPFKIDLFENGDIHFKGLVFSVQVNARDITHLKRTTREYWFGNDGPAEEDEAHYAVLVEYQGGKVTMPRFSELSDFSKQLQLLNPFILVDDHLWAKGNFLEINDDVKLEAADEYLAAAMSLYNQSLDSLELGNVTAAEGLLAQAKVRFQKALGENHPYIRKCIDNFTEKRRNRHS